MVAMGWTAPVGHDRLHELETVMRSEGDDDFFAWPVTSEKQIYTVLYLEPQSPANHSAIGYNAYSDPARRAAMVRAFDAGTRSEEHTSELQSLMRKSYAVLRMK